MKSEEVHNFNAPLCAARNCKARFISSTSPNSFSGATIEAYDFISLFFKDLTITIKAVSVAMA